MNKLIRALVKDIDPQVSILDIEGELLYKYSQKCKKSIVEIGSWKGRSTIWLASGFKGKGKVYAIDPHEGIKEGEARPIGKSYEDFIKNIKNSGLEDLIEPIIMTSIEAIKDWKENLDLIFIDGSHEYSNVLLDFLCWAPFIDRGGFVALHDTIGYIGPKRVLREIISRSPIWAIVAFKGQIAIARKTRYNPLNPSLNKVILILKDFYDWAFLTAMNTLPTKLKEYIKGAF